MKTLYVAKYEPPMQWNSPESRPPRIRLIAAETLPAAVELADAPTLTGVVELRFSSWPSHSFTVEDIEGLEAKA